MISGSHTTMIYDIQFQSRRTSMEDQKPKSLAVNSQDVALTPFSSQMRMTRRTVQELSSGTLYFKLGQEGTYKTYVNQYTTNPSALSKQQATEERLKRQHMSHKFSLTDTAAFKWVGSLHGGRNLLTNTLRQTMLQLEGNLPSMFMHMNWGLLRKPWIGAVGNCVSPRDFARALTVLLCCMKPCIMLQVWNDSLGHTQFKKITNMMKEEKKKLEKRDRKEREEEEERLRPFMGHVKYTLGLKHQVAKQKGEEYRLHGQNGWLWLSASRCFAPADANKMGLRAGPYRVAVKYSDVRDGTHKIVLMEPMAFAYFVAKQDEMDRKKKEEGESASAAATTNGEEQEEETKDESVKPECGGSKLVERKVLEEALKNARLERQKEPEELSRDVVDVCAGLSNPTRVMYPKVARKAKVLDEFLARRQQLKTLEEKRVQLRVAPTDATNKGTTASGAVSSNATNILTSTGELNSTTAAGDIKNPDSNDVVAVSESKTSIISSIPAPQISVPNPVGGISVASNEKSNKLNTFLTQAKKKIWAMVARVKESIAVNGNVGGRPKELMCYSPVCVGSEKPIVCYSPTCKRRKLECPILTEAREMHVALTKEAREIGLDLLPGNLINFATKETSVLELQNLVKNLMTKKEEFDHYSEIGMSTVTTTTTTCMKTTEKVTTAVNGTVESVTTTATSTITQTNSIMSEKPIPEGGKVVSSSEVTETVTAAKQTQVRHQTSY